MKRATAAIDPTASIDPYKVDPVEPDDDGNESDDEDKGGDDDGKGSDDDNDESKDDSGAVAISALAATGLAVTSFAF